MRLKEKHITIIQTLESKYGHLSLVPDDNEQLQVVRAYVERKEPSRLKKFDLDFRHLPKKPSYFWSEEEVYFLGKYHQTYSYKEISELIGRSERSIQQKIRKLGLATARRSESNAKN